MLDPDWNPNALGMNHDFVGIGRKCEPKTLLDTFPSFGSYCSAPGSRRVRKRKTLRTQSAFGFRREIHTRVSFGKRNVS